MTKEKSTVPRLRFPGFTDAWKQRKLGEYFVERLECSAEGELLSVTISDGVRRFSELGRKDNSSEDKTKYKVLKQGDIVYNSMRMWQGASGYSIYDGIVSPAYTVLIPTYLSYALFFSYLFKRSSSLQIFQVNSQGLTSDTWNLKYKPFSNIVFPAPTLPEQEAIGNFFSDLDQLITLHQRKLDDVKELKKALLQKMFPKGNGNDFPELRFPEFTDAWKQRKLGEVAVVVMGQSPDSKNYTNNPLDNILVQGNADLKNGNVEPRVWTTQITKIAEKGDIIVSVRAPVGDVAKTSYKVVLGRGVAGIKGNDFIYQTLIRMKQFGYWMKLSTGSTFESINSGDIKSSLIPLPTLPEQEAIGSFFSDLDQLITLHQRQLDHLKLLKKALLQQMFI
ncbi:restriction endonuclease subunit S [Streptococcus suis]|uniref:Type I restriction-modification system, specificity subunit S n=1 Tax=Streptococcus suis TaxID=1307 RepID=A0A0Z8LW61_STRSU|nr:restriction endonuclease subunit S [Streptococcus suis]NQG28557.1 restriction endonuclease subunit S [Streptococcus suis]CYV97990.1 type I restriction-modification system%2C specificity subunit S [Streptococcus suis]